MDNDGMMDRTGTTGATAIAMLMIPCLPAGDGVPESLNSTPWPRLVVYDNMDISRYS